MKIKHTRHDKPNVIKIPEEFTAIYSMVGDTISVSYYYKLTMSSLYGNMNYSCSTMEFKTDDE